jgi:hypothetical protein
MIQFELCSGKGVFQRGSVEGLKKRKNETFQFDGAPD